MRIFLIFIMLLSTATALTKDCDTKIPLIIDCDVDLDDIISFLLFFNHPSVDLLAITTTCNGKSHQGQGAKNVLRLLDYFEKGNIPVAHSFAQPLSFNGFFPESLRKETDQSGDFLSLPESTLCVSESCSSELMIQKLLSSEEKVVILCTAPLTNLARALTKAPQIRDHIERVYILGGAINLKGNLEGKHQGYYNRYAEYNFFLDAKAAEIVLSSHLPITLLPLDALANIALICTEVYRNVVKMPDSKEKNLIVNALNLKEYPLYQLNKKVNFWSSLAAMMITDSDIAEIMQLKVNINLEYGPYYGMLTIERKGFPIDVCFNVNYERFLDRFMETLLTAK